MKQRIRVTAICERDGKFLLLKRAAGRVEGMDYYELPTGKIIFGEQPDEAMARILYENLSVHAQELQLEDAITFTNLVNASELGNLFIVFRAELSPDAEIKLSNERHNAFRWMDASEITGLNLDEASAMVLQIMQERVNVKATVPGETTKEELQSPDEKNLTAQVTSARIYTDGACRGNPGPSGLGYYIVDENGRELKRGGEFLGFSTSRLAEYYGLKEGIEQAIELGLKKVHFYSDSLMLVNQMNGVYQVKNRDLMQIHTDILRLLEKLDSFSFTHVTRDHNREADREANTAIDNVLRKDEYL